MADSKNNIENRGMTVVNTCSTCKTPIKPVQVIRSGKGKMIGQCNCGFVINGNPDIRHLLG